MWGEDASAVVLDTCKETSKRKQPGASKPSAYVGKLAFCTCFQISLNDLQQSILMTWVGQRLGVLARKQCKQHAPIQQHAPILYISTSVCATRLSLSTLVARRSARTNAAQDGSECQRRRSSAGNHRLQPGPSTACVVSWLRRLHQILSGGNAGSNPAAGTLGSSVPRLRHMSNAQEITTTGLLHNSAIMVVICVDARGQDEGYLLGLGMCVCVCVCV